MNNSLDIINFCKTYSNNKVVFEKACLTIKLGKITVISGENGSGKTTLFNCLTGIDNDFNGKFIIKKNDVEIPLWQSKEIIAYIPQDNYLVNNLSALSNVIHGRQTREKSWRNLIQTFASYETRLEAIEIMDSLGLNEQYIGLTKHLSRGQKKKVAIARALMQRPTILIADEPTAGLDESTKKTILAKFINMSSNYKSTLIISMHDHGDAINMTRYIYMLENGAFKRAALT